MRTILLCCIVTTLYCAAVPGMWVLLTSAHASIEVLWMVMGMLLLTPITTPLVIIAAR